MYIKGTDLNRLDREMDGERMKMKKDEREQEEPENKIKDTVGVYNIYTYV